MCKKTTRWALALMAVLTLAVPAVSAVPEVSSVDAAAPLEDVYHVRVNGVPMTQDPMVTHVEGTTYVSLRAMANVLTADAMVAWNGQTATVTAPALQLSATPGQCYIVANDRYLYVPHLVQTRNGAVLLPLDVVCKAMDATLAWQADGSLELTRGTGGLLSGDAFYSADDLYWLSRIIFAESGNQPLSGKMAVGNVVLNRVSDSRFPDSIYGVVFQKNQFTPARTGTINRTPNADSVLAAKLCLDGATSLDNVLWFNRTGLNSWASRNRSYVATIAGHTFYA